MHDASVVIETDVPARLDRLPWTRFHTLVIVALGITWVLDGLEVTIAGSIVGALQESPVLHFTPAQIGLVATAYLAGAVAVRYTASVTKNNLRRPSRSVR
jgi:hypothetical protein